MTWTRLVFEHDVELSPAIVWDALVDDDLVAGWLGEARIEPIVGGRYRLSWLGSPESAPLDGVVERIEPRVELVVSSNAHGRLRFRLAEHDGGARGTWTRLHLDVEVEVEPAFVGRIRRNWTVALDQLDELLRGHPVDWSAPASDPDAPARSQDRSGG